MNQNLNNTEIEIELYNLWAAFKRRWKVGLFLLLLSIFLSAIAANKQETEYEAIGKLLFKINQTAALTGIGEDINNLNSLERNANPINTEIEVIKSIPIAEKTIAALKESDLLTSDLSAQELVKKLSVEPVDLTDVLKISYKTSNAQDGVNIVNYLMQTYLENNLLNSRENVLTARKIVDEQLPKARERVVEKERNLQEFKKKYKIIDFQEESNSILTKRDNIENEIKNIQVELQENRSKSEKIQKQLGMNPQQAIALQNLSQSPRVQETLDHLSQLQNEILQKKEIYQDQDPTMISLYNQVEFLENFLEDEVKKLTSFANQQFTINDFQNINRDTIQQDLTTSLLEVEQIISGLERKLAQLQSIQNKYQQSLINLPEVENEYKRLQLILGAAKSNYSFLLKTQEEITLVEQQNLNNVRVIESAQSFESPRQSIILLALGIAMGSILAISTMTTLEVMDKSIKTPEKLKEIFNYPVLGTLPNFDKANQHIFFKEMVDRSITQYLPKIPSNSQLSKTNEPESIVTDRAIVKLASHNFGSLLNSKSFSMMQAKLKIISEKQSVKTIVISSSLNQEGKSEVIANLALNIGKLGQKVLVIDANLHKPSQQEIWGIEHDEGLADVILDGKMLDLYIHRVSNNLDVLLSGKIIENPLVVINSQKMQLLIEDLSQNYDIVLIDSPSLIGNLDTLNLGKMVDGIILVARLGLLDHPRAKECQNLLEMTEQNVIGMVVNGVEQ